MFFCRFDYTVETVQKYSRGLGADPQHLFSRIFLYFLTELKTYHLPLLFTIISMFPLYTIQFRLVSLELPSACDFKSVFRKKRSELDNEHCSGAKCYPIVQSTEVIVS